MTILSNKKCIKRLSKYRSILYRLKAIGFERIFSNNLADATGVSASQVRKDFSLYEISGNKKGGYLVDELIEKLNEILRKTEIHKVILVGAGKIGQALITYKGFKKENIQIVAAFDTDPAKYTSDEDVIILPLKAMEAFVKENEIKTAIIAVPEGSAQQVMDILVDSGIEGVLNFAPIRLKSSKNLIINNVDLVMEMENLIYFVSEARKKGS